MAFNAVDYQNAYLNHISGSNLPTPLIYPGRGGGTGGYLVKDGGGYAPPPDTQLPADQASQLKDFVQSDAGASTAGGSVMDYLTPILSLAAIAAAPFTGGTSLEALGAVVGSGAGQAIGSNLGGTEGQAIGGLVGGLAGSAGVGSLTPDAAGVAAAAASSVPSAGAVTGATEAIDASTKGIEAATTSGLGSTVAPAAAAAAPAVGDALGAGTDALGGVSTTGLGVSAASTGDVPMLPDTIVTAKLPPPGDFGLGASLAGTGATATAPAASSDPGPAETPSAALPLAAGLATDPSSAAAPTDPSAVGPDAAAALAAAPPAFNVVEDPIGGAATGGSSSVGPAADFSGFDPGTAFSGAGADFGFSPDVTETLAAPDYGQALSQNLLQPDPSTLDLTEGMGKPYDPTQGPPPPKPPVPGAGPSTFDKAMSMLKSPYVRGAGALGFLGYNLAKGEPALPAAAGQLQTVTNTLTNTANSQLAAFNSGQLTPGQLAQIGVTRQNQANAIYQQLANAGVADPTKDTRYIMASQQIDNNAMIQTQAFLDSTLKDGLAAAGAASQNLVAMAQIELQRDQDFQASMNAALSAFGILTSSGTSLFKAAA